MNKRKTFDARLREMTQTELDAQRAQTQEAFGQASEEGNCAWEAVLWFDLKQIEGEIERRKLGTATL